VFSQFTDQALSTDSYHASISQALINTASEWCNSFDKKLMAFAIDNGFNIVKALESMNVLQLSCGGPGCSESFTNASSLCTTCNVQKTDCPLSLVPCRQ